MSLKHPWSEACKGRTLAICRVSSSAHLPVFSFRPLPKWEFKDFLGWEEQGDGQLAYGIFIQNGRLKGDLKKALRRVIERYELPVRLTPNQNLILCDIDESWKADIIHTLSGAGVR